MLNSPKMKDYGFYNEFSLYTTFLQENSICYHKAYVKETENFHIFKKQKQNLLILLNNFLNV